MAKEARELAEFAAQRGLSDIAGALRVAADVFDNAGLHQMPAPEAIAIEAPRLHPSLEGRFSISPLTIGGKPKGELLEIVRRKPANIYGIAGSVVENSAFTTEPEQREIDLAIGAVGDLVPNPKGQLATYEEWRLARAEKGLTSVPAEAALHYLLQHGDELQVGEAIWFDMDPIAGRRGNPNVLGVGRDDVGLWLDSGWTTPSSGWNPGHRVAFGLPQVTEA